MRVCRIIPISVALAIFAGVPTFGDEPAHNATSTTTQASSGTASGHISFPLATIDWLNRTAQKPEIRFGITVDPNIQQAPVERPLVILVHGFHSAPERLAALAAMVRQAGFPCGTLRYPNDQPIADSAALLSQELRRIAKEQPGRKIVLLTHSMGGLVAREAIENPALNPGNVNQLIMISPPTQGTSCAYITCSADLWEHKAHAAQRTLFDRPVASGNNGHGEARDELKPDSEFLKQLNGRSRNPDVRYTVFLGTGTALSSAALKHAEQVVAVLGHMDRFLLLFEPSLEQALSDFEDAAAEGDGVVSVQRGRLDGVTDTVLLGFDHWNAIGPPLKEPVAKLHREILDRLGRELLVHNQAASP